MPVRAIETGPAQRAVGRLSLGFRRDRAATRIEKFYQEGCLKARLPRPQDAEVCEAVTMNISGGVAGGDVLDVAIAAGEGARIAVASAAAERVYRALDAPCVIRTKIRLGPGAELAYLPQEAILFDGFALQRSLEIEMAADACYLGVESLVFGRQAMGETVNMGRLRDRILLRRDGKLIFQDMTRLDGDIADILARKAVAGGAVAMASIIYAAPEAASCLAALRAGLNGCEAGVSAFEGIVFIRILAASAISLRLCVVTALKICRNGVLLPRVWQL